ncbi:hypothetical protein CRYUN_Cryun05aG0120700 [Craigia yunnanensis]
MDLDDFRSVLETAGVDVWTFIDTAILVASLDYGQELKQRRDGIVERLYATSMVTGCKSCDFGERSNGYQVNKEGSLHEGKGGGANGSPFTPQSDNEGDDLDPNGGLFDDEQKRVLEIKELLEVPDQSEDSLVDLLQSLADMDITFQALNETDIGRDVNKLRKHSSNDVRRLVKQLVRKWKEIVDEWVRVNQPGELESATLMADGDSPQQKLPQNGRQQMGVLVQTRIIQNLKGSQSQSLLLEKILQLDLLTQLLHKMYRDKENKRKAILTQKGWLLQEKGFKKVTRKLKMPKSKERYK